jgi:peptidyl-prolyl cis-trans isomerase D
MISFFRKALSSWLVLGLLGLIMIAFIVTGVSNNGPGSDAAPIDGTTLATVGDRKIGEADAEQRLQGVLRQQQAQQPDLTMAQFVTGGGYEAVIDQIVSGAALEQFARKIGLSASKPQVDAEIVGIPAFRGPTGQFDENAMRTVLQQQRVTEAQLRADIASDAIRRQLLIPVSAAAGMPAGMALPYASLMLESRSGVIGLVPASALAGGPAPTDAELNGWYRSHLAAYTIPERRVIRYAVVGQESIAAAARPTEAEIAAAYKAEAASYAPTEKRTLTQVVADTEAKARSIAAAVSAGTPIAKAAATAGLAPATLAGRTRDQVADAATPAIAAAAFAAPQGMVTAPAKSDFGWTIMRVDAIERVAGRTLAQVRDEIAAKLAAARTKDLLADAAAKIDDAISDGSSFDDVVKSQKLAVQTTPALLANGTAPDQPGWTMPADVQPLLKSANDLSADDDPVVATIVPEQRFALVSVAKVVPAAAPPLAVVRARVLADLTADRAQSRAKAIADAIATKANGGTPLSAAFAAAPVRLPAPQPTTGRRADLMRGQQQVPPPLSLMFSMASGKTRVLEAPGKQGWWVVSLNRIVPGDARQAPQLVEGARRELAKIVGEEYLEQFAAAARATVGVKADSAAIGKLKARLAGAGVAE